MSQNKTREFSISKPTKAKKDRSLLPMLAVALIVFILAAIPMAWGMRHTFKYRNYMTDLRDEFIKGERFGTITAEYEGEVYSLSKENAGRVFKVVSFAGMGRTCDPMETEFSEWTLIDLGHGTTLFLAPTRMIIEYEEEVSGLYVEYTFKNGKKYCYETDNTQFYHIRNILRDVMADAAE